VVAEVAAEEAVVAFVPLAEQKVVQVVGAVEAAGVGVASALGPWAARELISSKKDGVVVEACVGACRREDTWAASRACRKGPCHKAVDKRQRRSCMASSRH
jgi:hypothetical protein